MARGGDGSVEAVGMPGGTAKDVPRDCKCDFDRKEEEESLNSNPKTLGSIHWRGMVMNSCSVPPSQTLVCICLCLTPLRVYGTHPNLCAR